MGAAPNFLQSERTVGSKLFGVNEAFTSIDLFIYFPYAEDSKQEDIIFSLLRFLLIELVHVAHLNASMSGINKVYFCGNFVNHEVVRREITTTFSVRNVFEMNQVKYKLKYVIF